MTGRLTKMFERLLFRHRRWFLGVFGLLTVFMGWSASGLRVDTTFTKQLPLSHAYIQTFLKHQELFGGANRVVIGLVRPHGDIFTPEFFQLLREVTDELFFVPGVDRASVTSLMTPNVRFVEVVEDGLTGGSVIPANFQPTAAGFAVVRDNIVKSGRVGQLVANDFGGAIVSAQLLEVDPTTQQRLDYIAVAHALEERIRTKFQGAAAQAGCTIHIIGFAKVIGDVADGARVVLLFLVVSVLLTAACVRLYSRSTRLTLMPLLCSLVAVVWQLGLLPLLGFGLDPMSILVPFLVFAIGMSHGVQMIQRFRTAVFAGLSRVDAARSAFRQLLLPGGLALVTDTIGFITILLIDVGVVRELAIAASLGVGIIIVTNLLLLPVALSYVNLPATHARLVRRRRAQIHAWWRRFDGITHARVSLLVIGVAAGLFAFGCWKSPQVRVGDLHAGVPELRENSRYNQDTAVITRRFSIGVDLITVIVETVPNGCIATDVMSAIARFEWQMRNVPGVRSVVSLGSVARVINAGWNEGSLKWRTLPQRPEAMAQAVSPVETSTGLLNADGSVLPVHIFLADHRAETIERVVTAVRGFQERFGSPRAQFRLATGNAGVMAATNEVVRDAQFPILLWVFGSVIALCLLTFRSWRATLCIVLPLALVSVLAYALMVYLEIGLKISTLPVAALGVGIGVDYGIYLYAQLDVFLKKGFFFEDAMLHACSLTGTAVVLTGVTLALGVATWIFSPLKFQADMGILLTFMFLLNMLGAIVLLPALARWLFRHHPMRGRPLGRHAPGGTDAVKIRCESGNSR